MKIGVLSDTHNNLSDLIMVLETFRERGISTIIHCGDLTDHALISCFRGFRLIYTFGNTDAMTGAIQKKVNQMGEDNFAGPVFRGKIAGVPIAATHSHIEGQVMALVREKKYQWIFHGHTHRKRDEVIHGAHIINPGAVGNIGRDARSFCIVDLDTGNVEFLKLS